MLVALFADRERFDLAATDIFKIKKHERGMLKDFSPGVEIRSVSSLLCFRERAFCCKKGMVTCAISPYHGLWRSSMSGEKKVLFL